MTKRPSLPPDKQRLHNSYHNWIFLRVDQKGGILELTFDSKKAWGAAILMFVLCLAFGIAIHYFLKNAVMYLVAVPTALGFFVLTWYVTRRQMAEGPLLRLHPATRTVDAPKHRQSFKTDSVILKLQYYRSSEGVCSELNLESLETNCRYPVARWLGRYRRFRRTCESFAQHGLRFEEEDLTTFAS